MFDYYIGQIFENEYPTKAASFASEIQIFEKVERTVDRIESRPGVRTGTYVVFTDGTEKSIVPCEIKIYVKGTKHMMSRFKIVEIPEPTQDEKDLDSAKQEEQELQSFLSSTDYVAAKLAEGVATKEEYADVLQQRAEARDRINVLRASQESLTAKIAETKA